MRMLVFVVLAGCSSGGGGADGEERRPTKAAADAAPEKQAPAKAEPAADRWTGTFEGRTEPTPAPMPSRNVAPNTPPPDAGPNAPNWSGNGTMTLAVTGENVEGSIESGGRSAKLGGTLVAGKLRAWLAGEDAAGARWMGRVEGATEGEAIKGTWRASTSGGVEVRAGTFEIRRQ